MIKRSCINCGKTLLPSKEYVCDCRRNGLYELKQRIDQYDDTIEPIGIIPCILLLLAFACVMYYASNI